MRSAAHEMRWCATLRRGRKFGRPCVDRFANNTEESDELREVGLLDSRHYGRRHLNYLRQYGIKNRLRRRGDFDEDSTSIRRIGQAQHVAVAYQRVEHTGHGGAGDVHGGADFSYGNRTTMALNDGQSVEGGVGETMSLGDRGDRGFGERASYFEVAKNSR